MFESDIAGFRALDRFGRGSGLAGAGVAIALWAMFLTRVNAPPGSSGSVIVAGLMIFLAALSAVSAATGRAIPLVGAAALSLLPVGLYLLMTPSIYSGIGLANLLSLAGGVALLMARRGASPRT